jgi:hypothetical protein
MTTEQAERRLRMTSTASVYAAATDFDSEDAASYVYLDGEGIEVAGPYATLAEAEAAADRMNAGDLSERWPAEMYADGVQP